MVKRMSLHLAYKFSNRKSLSIMKDALLYVTPPYKLIE